nr:hypothetical transcript [Hymenolepis microstoma]
MELPKFLHYTFLSPLVIATHFSSYSSSYSSSTSYFFRSLQINFTFPNYLFNLPQSHCRSLPPILSFSAQVYQPPCIPTPHTHHYNQLLNIHAHTSTPTYPSSSTSSLIASTA